MHYTRDYTKHPAGFAIPRHTSAVAYVRLLVLDSVYDFRLYFRKNASFCFQA